jgi:hypothetical protein
MYKMRKKIKKFILSCTNDIFNVPLCSVKGMTTNDGKPYVIKLKIR